MNRTAEQPPSLILPPALNRGDTVGLVAPAGPILAPEKFTAGVRMLAEMGLAPRFANDLTARRDGYLAGSDHDRASEFNQLWADREVKALIAVRGGYGCQRLLDKIDFDLVRRQPKILVGFSDISILLNTVVKRAGLVTFHGPMVTTLPGGDRETTTAFLNAITGRQPQSIKPQGLEVLLPGTARGRLLGGNLASLVHTLATPDEPDWRGAILLLEDVGEAVYRVDRMLTHLHEAGRLAETAGLILGEFKDCGDQDLIWQRAVELLKGLDVPVWGNFPCGHGRRNHILPLGLPAEMDSATGTLHFSGPWTSS